MHKYETQLKQALSAATQKVSKAQQDYADLQVNNCCSIYWYNYCIIWNSTNDNSVHVVPVFTLIRIQKEMEAAQAELAKTQDELAKQKSDVEAHKLSRKELKVVI